MIKAVPLGLNGTPEWGAVTATNRLKPRVLQAFSAFRFDSAPRF